MPNHVYHTMIIDGTPEQLDALWVRLNPEPYDDDPDKLSYNLFQAFEPMPEEYNDTISGVSGGEPYRYPDLIAKYGANDWYEWQLQHWGVKWGTYDTHIERQANHLVLTFTTAWGSPYPFFAKHLSDYWFRYRAHEEALELLIEGDNSGVEFNGGSFDTEAHLTQWVEQRGGSVQQYVETENGYDLYIDWYKISDEWMSEVLENGR